MATMNNSQQLPFTIVITDSTGAPAAVSGIPTAASSDETIVTVVMAADGMSGVAKAVAPSANPARVTITANADLDASGVVMDITGVSEDITVTQDPARLASVINFTFGPAEAKTA